MINMKNTYSKSITLALLVVLLIAGSAWAMKPLYQLTMFYGGTVTKTYLAFGAEKITLGGNYVLVRE